MTETRTLPAYSPEDWRVALAHGHGLDTIDGFRLVLTVRGFEILDEVDLLAEFHAPNLYGAAVDLAEVYRKPAAGTWAVIDTRYVCGCWSTERDNFRLDDEAGE